MGGNEGGHLAMTKDEAAALDAVDRYVRENNVGYSLRGGAKRDPNGEAEGIISEPDQFVGLHASTEIFVKDAADLLTKRYPGFRWAIQPNEFGKVMNIFCIDFHSIWGYVVRYDDIMNDPKRSAVIRAGREILRRFRYPGSRYRPELMAQIKRTADGNAIPDVSDLKPSRFTKKADLEFQLATGKAKVVGTTEKGRVIQVSR